MIRNRAYYKKEYIDKERSLHDLARENHTFPNQIRRELISFGFSIRNKSEAQKAALRHGRHKHPTKGKPRPLDVKMKIAASVSEARQNAKSKEVRNSRTAK